MTDIECDNMLFNICSKAIGSQIHTPTFRQRGVNKHNLLKAALRREKILKEGNVAHHRVHLVTAAKQRIAGHKVCDDAQRLKKAIRRKHTMLKQRSRKRKVRQERAHNEATDAMTKKVTATRKGMREKAKAKRKAQKEKAEAGPQRRGGHVARAGGQATPQQAPRKKSSGARGREK